MRPFFKQQAVRRGILRRGIRAIGTVKGSEERIIAMRREVFQLNAGDAEAHAVTREMAGAATSPVGAQALEEDVVAAVIDRAGDVERGDKPRGVQEWEEVGNQCRRCNGGQTQDSRNEQPLAPSHSTTSQGKLRFHVFSSTPSGVDATTNRGFSVNVQTVSLAWLIAEFGGWVNGREVEMQCLRPVRPSGSFNEY